MAKDQIIGVMNRSPTPEQDPEHEANDDDDPNGPAMTAPHAIPGPSRGPTVDFEDLSDEEAELEDIVRAFKSLSEMRAQVVLCRQTT